jgi:hypothetical protein
MTAEAQVTLALRGRNPDVLTCIANLSNDEVFTPPEDYRHAVRHGLTSLTEGEVIPRTRRNRHCRKTPLLLRLRFRGRLRPSRLPLSDLRSISTFNQQRRVRGRVHFIC